MVDVMFDQKDFFKKFRQLIKQQEYNDARLKLLNVLRLDMLDPAGVLQAGRMINRMSLSGSFNVSIFGQFTTSWLAHALQASAAAGGEILNVVDGPYDNVMQGLMTLNTAPDVLILLPWNQRLFVYDRTLLEQRLEDEFNFWSQAWEYISQTTHARIIQVGYDWINAGASGQFLAGQPDGFIHSIRTLNQRLRESLPDSAYFVDLEQVSGISGRKQFYDTRNYLWAKQPLSDSGTVLLSRYLWAGIRASLYGPKKVLVLDLDNTLWGGVVGEVGALGVVLSASPAGEAFRNFQLFLKQLKDKGCMLAICSKNNDEDAREPFEKNPDMLLSLNDFVAIKTGWGSKSESIKKISTELNISLDSFVFFDDSRVEQEEIRMVLPEVEVVNVPEDPVDYCDALLEGLWFESITVTAEDKQKTSQYQTERKRVELCNTFNTIEDYLLSLKMTADVRHLNEFDLDRAVQLIGKTNQFNLTTRRHSRDDILAFLSIPDSLCLTLRLNDRFGDYGFVSLILTHADTEGSLKKLVIDTWLMSCRAIGRTVEHFLFRQLLIEARKLGFQRIVGEYIPTKKNAQVENLYKEFGFVLVDRNDKQNEWYELNIEQASLPETYIEKSIADD